MQRPLEVKPAAPTANVMKTPRGGKTPLTNKSKLSTPMTNGAAATPSAAALKREAQRKKLQEMKRRNREAMAAAANSNTTNESSPIEIVGVVELNNETNATS